MIAEDWPKYATRPGRNETSLDELSFEAWVKQYKPAENFTNRAVSYYEKGFWTGMALDLELRLASGGAPRAARDVPPAVGPASAAPGARSSRRTCATPPRRSRAARLDRFFERYVHGTEELPLPALLRRAGLRRHRARRVGRERQARPPSATRSSSGRARAWTGIALQPERTVIRNVVPDSPAWRAGLTFNDDVVAVDGVRVDAATFAKRVADRPPGARVRVAYFRRDELLEARLIARREPRAQADRHRRSRGRRPREGRPRRVARSQGVKVI